MSAYKCTYDEYMDTPNEAVTNLLAVRRAIAKGRNDKQQADSHATQAQQGHTPHIG